MTAALVDLALALLVVLLLAGGVRSLRRYAGRKRRERGRMSRRRVRRDAWRELWRVTH